MMNDTINYNSKGQYHGYQQLYSGKDKISYRAKLKNNKPIGYEESIIIKKTNFYIR